MSLNQFPDDNNSPASAAANAADHRASCKRKLDDYVSSALEGLDGDLAAIVRMRKDDFDSSSLISTTTTTNGATATAVRSPSNGADDSSSSSSAQISSLVSKEAQSVTLSSSGTASGSSEAGSTRVQFFVRLMNEGNYILMQANSFDTVKSVHERIQAITGIPIMEQRLIYQGRQLQWEQSLAECAIENDTNCHLVGRMRSTKHPRTTQLLDELVSFIIRCCKSSSPCHSRHIKLLMSEFFNLTPKDDNEAAIGHLKIFLTSSVPAALVMLYISPTDGFTECANNCIRHFLNACRNSLPKHLYLQCTPIVLEFCKLLRKVAPEDPLYLSCRATLACMLEGVVGAVSSVRGGPLLYKFGVGDELRELIAIPEVFPFVCELGKNLARDLVHSMEARITEGPLPNDVRDFSSFLLTFRLEFMEKTGLITPISIPVSTGSVEHLIFVEEIEQLHALYRDLLSKMDVCLRRMEDSMALKDVLEVEHIRPGWSQYLTVLKELNSIAKIYMGGEGQFREVLTLRKAALCALILKNAKPNDDHQWLCEYKDLIDFEFRRHLAMMMFSEVKEEYDDLHEMLIDRSQLLAESFEYIGHAEPDMLRGGIFMEFKNEEATGPGVLREWFFLVAQAIFNPENALFLPCPNDRRRFYPNPASRVDPMHLEYFTFAGRVIALALLHRLQVGIAFDRVFFLQLAGMHLSLEDIKDADPGLYRSCKQILEMDAEFIDSDALGLTFVREVEELGSRMIVELRPGGKSLIVNSKNREEYVNLLIHQRFVSSISEQVSHFARGFGDILSNSRLQKSFFQILKLEDLDWILYGSDHDICINDWRAHTDYNGYKETDPQISWFWQIVEEMSAEQRKILLFFWTSVKCLPIEGFRGLASRLYIYKTSERLDHLPSSHTCFYRLCFPPYFSKCVMKDRLRVITQEHFGYSFGTW